MFIHVAVMVKYERKAVDDDKLCNLFTFTRVRIGTLYSDSLEVQFVNVSDELSLLMGLGGKICMSLGTFHQNVFNTDNEQIMSTKKP